MGTKHVYEALMAIDRASVVIDCTPAGNENKERLYLHYGQNAHGFIAQGSGFGFGNMYAREINDAALRPDPEPDSGIREARTVLRPQIARWF